MPTKSNRLMMSRLEAIHRLTGHSMSLNDIYYRIKPFAPRWLLIEARRQIILQKRAQFSHVWPIDEQAKAPPKGWRGWPNGKRFALVLTHDVETAKGQKRCIELARLEESFGFRSSFNFVAEEYPVSVGLRKILVEHGFEIGIHGLHHNKDPFRSRNIFQPQVGKINHYLKEWEASGFRCPCMYHNLDWISELNIEYDSSTFDTDPFEPQPDGVRTIFPFWVPRNGSSKGFVELPYTLPQDHTLFSIMKEKNIDIWKQKLDWTARNGGMALLITHPDYMSFNGNKPGQEEYPVRYYEEFLNYIKSEYHSQYWNGLPKEVTRFWNGFVQEGVGTKDQQGDRRTNAPPKLISSGRAGENHKKIWIDLDNSPHVPFFHPIIHQLEKRGYSVVITARDRFQVCELADQLNMEYKSVGRYYGKNKIVKLFWLTFRALQLFPTVLKRKPKLAVSHGSRSQLLLAKTLGIPSVSILDYEYAKGIPFFHPSCTICPDIIPENKIEFKGTRLLKYQGIKEDVYVPYFRADDQILDELDLNKDHLIVTIRPPAMEAHYFNVESEKLFESAMDFLCPLQDIQLVLLPRNEKQKALVSRRWAQWVRDGKITIPKKAVDGLNLIWHSDLVISGGGTMNREAAALGVPVYSIFRGTIGAIDRYLTEKGRLVLIENKDQLYSKVVLTRRNKTHVPVSSANGALQTIVSQIVNMIEVES